MQGRPGRSVDKADLFTALRTRIADVRYLSVNIDSPILYTDSSLEYNSAK